MKSYQFNALFMILLALFLNQFKTDITEFDALFHIMSFMAGVIAVATVVANTAGEKWSAIFKK